MVQLPFAFRTGYCRGVAASLVRLSYGAGVLKAPSMLNRSILVRGAFMGLLLVGLVALADGIVRQELRQATSDMIMASATVIAEPAGASDE